jgi:hypothetical protein
MVVFPRSQARLLLESWLTALYSLQHPSDKTVIVSGTTPGAA